MNRNQYIAVPMTAEQVQALHHDLWMAIVLIPKHKHRTAIAEGNCSVCNTHHYLMRAYKGLPRAEVKE